MEIIMEMPSTKIKMPRTINQDCKKCKEEKLFKCNGQLSNKQVGKFILPTY